MAAAENDNFISNIFLAEFFNDDRFEGGSFLEIFDWRNSSM